MSTTTERWRHEVADHLEAIVRILRREDSTSEPAPSAPTAAAEDPIDIARRVHPALGGTQEKVLAQVAGAHPSGISAGDIARTLDMSSPNAHLTLVSLVRQRLVHKDDTKHPQLYFIGSRILSEMT